jgi:hypothetical protein
MLKSRIIGMMRTNLKEIYMKKNYSIAILAIFFTALAGCGQGFITTNPPPAQTYSGNFTNFYEIATSSDSSCNVYSSPFNCSKESSTITLNLSFTSNTYSPVYWLIPNPLPSGVTLTQSPGCSNQTGSNYSCILTFNATNMPESSIINIPFNGSLGQQANYIISYQ